jgi:hypothetical protein
MENPGLQGVDAGSSVIRQRLVRWTNSTAVGLHFMAFDAMTSRKHSA